MTKNTVDLNRLRSMILDNQSNEENLPTRPADKVLVDREGAIRLGNEVAPSEARQLSEVHQGTFHALEHEACIREILDQTTVAAKLPAATRRLRIDGVMGWLYPLRNPVGDTYSLFAYFDGSQYQILVAFPQIAGRYNVHDAHLFSDGRICLSDIGGLPTLEQAYAKSVVWATGFSVFLHTGHFPFSINN